jgi:hypothetical protein
MNAISRDIRFHLPNHDYLKLVADYLLLRETGQPPIDPFALDVPGKRAEGVYVERQVVEKEIGQWDTQIAIGPEGTGKTTLFNRLPALSPRQTLVLRLSLAEMAASISEAPAKSDPIDSQLSALLVRRIFDAYWEELLQQGSVRAQYLGDLRRDKSWMDKLRWFFQNTLPVHPDIPSEFELAAWLKTVPPHEPFGRLTAQATLTELVQWVTSAVPAQPQYGVRPPQPYVRVQVGVDQDEALSEETSLRLLQALRRLRALYPGQLGFKLFSDTSWGDMAQELSDVQQGRMRIYRLPRWRADELRRMLHFRLAGQKPGEYSESLRPTGEVPETRAHEWLAAHFNEQELRTLCFKLGIDYDDLVAQGRENKARELVTYMARRSRLDELIAAIQRERPETFGAATRTGRTDQVSSPATGRPLTDYDWGRYLTAAHLEAPAQSQLVDVIIQGALRAYDLGDDLDAPIHALRLARGLLAACAGCWADSGYAPPLSVAQLHELTDLYWKTT